MKPTIDLFKYINKERLEKFKYFLREMNARGLADWYGKPYVTDGGPATKISLLEC